MSLISPACRAALRHVTGLMVVNLLCCTLVLADGSAPVDASPRQPWGDFEVVEEDTSRTWWEQVLLWPINRVIDIYDILRVDVGVGGSAGGVVRVTSHAQAGYRRMFPGSMRVGAFGRSPPILVESSDEVGAGGNFKESSDREICVGEVGIGLDVFVAGAYLGICGEEVIDFISGIFFLDTADDDIR